jgi:hypothetical protein
MPSGKSTDRPEQPIQKPIFMLFSMDTPAPRRYAADAYAARRTSTARGKRSVSTLALFDGRRIKHFEGPSGSRSRTL